MPGTLSGGCRLDETGRLGFNQSHAGTSRPVVLDVAAGTAEPLPGTSPGQHLLLSGPRAGLFLIAEHVDGDLRLGHGRFGERRPLCFPGGLNAVEGGVMPMAAAPSGEHVALRVDRGARSHLLVYTPPRELIREIEIPPGVIHGTGHWSEHGLRFPFSGPTRPTAIATISGDGAAPNATPSRWEFTDDDDPADPPRWVDARACVFDGPTGPIEAVVCGEVDWRDARHLLLALHDGPEAASRLTFDPVWQALASAGICVVAPNHRGSTGYGLAHQQAIHGAWGGPDLADIRHLARELTRRRRQDTRLMIFGESYGAFLAMLAAGADPELWSHCVAVAPFISGPRLYEAGSPGVRALLDRLEGRTIVDDGLGPRDLTRLCGRITAQLMIIHAADDSVIPVSQSRELRRCLLRAGRREGRDFRYAEPAIGGHGSLMSGNGHDLVHDLVRFLYPRHVISIPR